MKLKKDLYSTGKPGKPRFLIAKKGEPLTLISERGNVLIVWCGLRRMSVKKEDVDFQKTETATT